MNSNMEKKNTRISKQQKEKLVDYMSNNLAFARSQFGGINSNVSGKEQWETLATLLNSLGGSAKSVDQWRKCWTDLKCGVKKQVNARRTFMNKTGGGSRADIPRDLNDLEKQILSIITTAAVDGDSQTPESGVGECLPFEESMLSIQVLKEETQATPAKKLKLSGSTSKYKESMEEAREMTNKVLKKLDAIESQNTLILQKMEAIETAFDMLR